MGLAICLQQLPQECESTHTGLPAPPASLQEEAMAAAESVLAADQRIADTIDGLECMIIQSKYYINMGKPRTAWLIGQRALSTCHVFGVHNGSGDQSDKTRSRWEAVRLKFWNRDRQLSLLLGLPYASPLLQRDLPTVDDAYINTQGSRAIWMQLGVFSGHVTDRNLDPKKATFSQTLDIDHEMETFKSALPFERLESPSDPNLSLQAIEDIFLSRFIFHNIRKLLHLPYMLMAMTDKRFEYSRDAALNASREMIGIYLILRDPVRPVLSICNLEDFHTLTAAMVLIINLLGRPANPVDLQDAERDWLLVQDVAEEFRSLKVLRGCSVAKQGSRQK